MKIIPSEFTKIAWECFLIAKNKAYLSKHQNIDSEHLLLSILENVEWANILLEKNKWRIIEINTRFTSSLVGLEKSYGKKSLQKITKLYLENKLNKTKNNLIKEVTVKF